MIGTCVVAGREVLARLQAEVAAKVPRGTRGYESERLCEVQSSQGARGFLGAQLVKSLYGWSVRYDSGLQNFGLIAGSRSGQLNGSLEDAVRYARAWQAEDPERRYVTCPDSCRDELEALGVRS